MQKKRRILSLGHRWNTGMFFFLGKPSHCSYLPTRQLSDIIVGPNVGPLTSTNADQTSDLIAGPSLDHWHQPTQKKTSDLIVRPSLDHWCVLLCWQTFTLFLLANKVTIRSYRWAIVGSLTSTDTEKRVRSYRWANVGLLALTNANEVTSLPTLAQQSNVCWVKVTKMSISCFLLITFILLSFLLILMVLTNYYRF